MAETKSFFRKALDAMIEARQRQAQYQIERYDFTRRDIDKRER